MFCWFRQTLFLCVKCEGAAAEAAVRCAASAEGGGPIGVDRGPTRLLPHHCTHVHRPLPLPGPPAGDRDLYGAPLLVLANKSDVAGALPPSELAAHFGVGTFDTRPCSVQAVTARTGEGVKAAVQWLVEAVKKSSRPELIRRRLAQ